MLCLCCALCCDCAVTVLRLCSPDLPVDSPHRFFVEWLVSTGQTVQEPNDDGPATLQPIFRVHSGMPLEIVEQFLAHSAGKTFYVGQTLIAI